MADFSYMPVAFGQQRGESEIDYLNRVRAEELRNMNAPFRPGQDWSDFSNAATRAGHAYNQAGSRIAALEAQQSQDRRDSQFSGQLSDLINRADPFAGQRAGYQQQLSALMTNPTAAIESNPFLKASSEQGMEAARRKLNQIGMGVSGNAALELQKAAQANLSNDFFKLSDLLGGFAGAKADPSAGAQIGLGAMKLREDARQFDVSQANKAPAVSGRLMSSYQGGTTSGGPGFQMNTYRDTGQFGSSSWHDANLNQLNAAKNYDNTRRPTYSVYSMG